MGWSGSLTSSSAVGSEITFTPDSGDVATYTTTSFKAPKKGVYRFTLNGSGGRVNTSGHNPGAGGAGGKTVGYLLLEENQTVYIGAGTTCCAAFVSKIKASTLAGTSSKSNLYFVAGGGGEGGDEWGASWYQAGFDGGAGGGTSGAAGSDGGANTGKTAKGGTQSSGYAYGTGETGGYKNSNDISYWRGRGGDGLYGGYAGTRASFGSDAAGGGGGSGYIYTSSITVNGQSYSNSTTQGGGAASNKKGSVKVRYHAVAELPITFNGTKITELIFNGTKVTSVIYNGTKLF